MHDRLLVMHLSDTSMSGRWDYKWPRTNERCVDGLQCNGLRELKLYSTNWQVANVAAVQTCAHVHSLRVFFLSKFSASTEDKSTDHHVTSAADVVSTLTISISSISSCDEDGRVVVDVDFIVMATTEVVHRHRSDDVTTLPWSSSSSLVTFSSYTTGHDTRQSQRHHPPNNSNDGRA